MSEIIKLETDADGLVVGAYCPVCEWRLEQFGSQCICIRCAHIEPTVAVAEVIQSIKEMEAE